MKTVDVRGESMKYYIIDNHGDRGDASVALDGFPQKIAATSTVVGAAIEAKYAASSGIASDFIMWSLTSVMVEKMLKDGFTRASSRVPISPAGTITISRSSKSTTTSSAGNPMQVKPGFGSGIPPKRIPSRTCQGNNEIRTSFFSAGSCGCQLLFMQIEKPVRAFPWREGAGIPLKPLAQSFPMTRHENAPFTINSFFTVSQKGSISRYFRSARYFFGSFSVNIAQPKPSAS